MEEGHKFLITIPAEWLDEDWIENPIIKAGDRLPCEVRYADKHYVSFNIWKGDYPCDVMEDYPIDDLHKELDYQSIDFNTFVQLKHKEN